MTDAPAAAISRAVSHRRLSPWLGVCALYVALALVYAWPLLGAMGSSLPSDAGDPALNAWILWWNSHAVPLSERWWNAPMFFPARGAFALSETLLGLAPLTTLLQWAGATPVVAYNVAFLASFPAAALAAHALAYRLTGRHDASLIAGLAFGFSPYRAAQLPHLQILWSCWMPLCLLSLHRFLDSRRRVFLGVAGLGWVLNGLTTGYFLMYFAVLAALWIAWFARSWRDVFTVSAVLAAASLAIAPVLVGYAQHQSALGLMRDSSEIWAYSADLSAIWAAAPHVWLPASWTLPPKPEGELYPGGVILMLAALGAVEAWRHAGPVSWPRWRIVIAVIGGYLAEVVALTMLLGPWHVSIAGVRLSMTRPAKPLFIAACLLMMALLSDRRVRDAWRRRSPLFFYATAAVLMLAFALGPVARAFGEAFWPRAPYFWLMELPGGHALRVPARFAMLLVLCLAQAAAIGFARLTAQRRRTALSAAVAAAVALDGWVLAMPIARAPDPIAFSATDSGAAAVLELPFRGVAGETAAMSRVANYGIPVVNGFSGYFPPHYLPMRDALQAHEGIAFDALRQFGSLLVLVQRALDSDGREEVFVRAQPQAEFVASTDLGPIYRLPARSRPEPGGLPLTVVSVQASVNPDLAGLIADGLPETRWRSGLQAIGAWIEVTLAVPHPISRLELDAGSFPGDYPRDLRIAVGEIEGGLTVVWEGRTDGIAAMGILSEPRRSPVAIPLSEAVVGRRLRVTLASGHGDREWSVTGVRVFGR